MRRLSTWDREEAMKQFREATHFVIASSDGTSRVMRLVQNKPTACNCGTCRRKNSTAVELKAPKCAGCARCKPDLAALTAAQRAEIHADVTAFVEGERVAARRRLLEERIAARIQPIVAR